MNTRIKLTELTNETDWATTMAAEHIRPHNLCSVELKAEFKKIGARMWQDDDMQVIRKRLTWPDPLGGIAANYRRDPAAVLRRSAAVQPLTQLDSFPNIPWSVKDKLDITCAKIAAKYNREWDAFVKQNPE